MKPSLAFLATLLLLAGCTSQPPAAEAGAAPPAEVEPAPLAFAEVGYKTPEHLRSTGGDNCAPLPETGVATLYCNFIEMNPDIRSIDE